MAKFSDESVRAAISGRFQIRKCAMPGVAAVVMGIRVLTDAEMDDCHLEAQSYLKSRDKTFSMDIDPHFFDRLLWREVVSRAFVDWEKHDEPFFSSLREVAELDAVTVLALFELYSIYQQEADPYRFCSEEEVDRLVAALGKSENAVGFLNEFDAPTLRTLLLSTVRRLLENLPKPS